MRPLLVLSLLLAGCANQLPPVREPPPPVQDPAAENAYRAALKKWERRASVYNGFDTIMFAAAVYESMPFREQKVRRLAMFRDAPEAEVAELLAHERAEHAEALTFTIGVHASREIDDLDRKDSIWRVALVSDAGEATPVSVERLGRPDPNLRGLYPFLDEFWTGYKVKFPVTFTNGARVLPEGTEHFLLRFASSVGKAELTFDTEPPQTTPSAAAETRSATR